MENNRNLGPKIVLNPINQYNPKTDLTYLVMPRSRFTYQAKNIVTIGAALQLKKLATVNDYFGNYAFTFICKTICLHHHCRPFFSKPDG